MSKVLLNKLAILSASIAGAVVVVVSHIVGANAVLPIMTGMIIGVLFSIINEIGLLRKLVERIEKVAHGYIVDGFENVVNEITYAIKEVQKDVGEDIYIRRALPVEFTSIDERVSSEYVKIISDIISGGETVNYYCDESIYGYHFRKDYRIKTYNFIRDIFLKNAKNNNTSCLYVTKSLRNLGLILVGKGTRMGHPEEFYWGFVITGTRLDKALVSKNETIIKIINELWESFRDLCKEDQEGSTYIDFFQIESERVQKEEEKIKKILEV